MRSKISIDKFIDEKSLKKQFNQLYKICRSILGKGFRDSLEIIGNTVDLDIKKLNLEQKSLIGKFLMNGILKTHI